mmetsp:Transcript_3735/g.11576  ORF Transcript_3735/g.11576 Transcript_3735/m.11576 type:complete len:1175 (-) Transcript_3735:180-3704(-)
MSTPEIAVEGDEPVPPAEAAGDEAAPTARPNLGPRQRAAVFLDIAEGENQRSDKEHEPGSVFKLAVARRRPVCCFLSLINLGFVVLTIGLAVGGYDPINTDNLSEVGLILPDDKYQRRHNGFHEGKKVADFALAGGKCPRQDVADPITFRLMRGSFESEHSGNALTKNGLSKLRQREEQVMTKNGWSDRCAMTYATDYQNGCEPALSLELPSEGGGAVPYYLQSDANGCMQPYSPVYMFAKYGDPEFDDISGTVARIQASSAMDWQSLQDMLHKDFTPENLKSKILISQIYAGTPRQPVSSYVNPETLAKIEAGARISYYSDSDKEDEKEHLGNWIGRHLKSDFDKNFENGKYPTTFNYVEYDPVNDQVTVDLSYIAISICLVFLYMAYYTGSFFIASMGMFQIVCSFAGANLLYRYCWPTATGLGYNYFTLFCALSLFIIMGIGADDIFVYWDTWTASEHVPYESEAHRLKHAWSHAAGAMLVTSSTTILSFLSNLSSPFIGVVTFGVFSALLVFVNFCAVTTFFPMVVLVYDKHVAQLLPCVGRASSAVSTAISAQASRLWARCRGGANAAEDAADADANDKDLDADAGEDAAEKEPWFSRVYAPWLFRYRRYVIGAHVALWIVGVYFAATLEVTPFKTYELLPETSNFYQFNFINAEWTAKSSDPLNVNVIFGLKHRDPLIWDGSADKFTDSSGKPRFDNGFDLDPTDAQIQLIRVAEDLATNPRRGLKVNTKFGINPQLDSSTTGSLLDTIGGGRSASVQSAYGIQSLLHALRQWENVSVAEDLAEGIFVAPPSNRSCQACFPKFSIDSRRGLETLQGLDNLRDGCTCVGFFPLPEQICLYETIEVSEGTRYKCTIADYNVAFELEKFFVPETGPDIAWWDDYIFFRGDNEGIFDFTALYQIQVQTHLRGSEGDFRRGLNMANKWDNFMDSQNGKKYNPLRVMVYVPGSEGWVVGSLLKGSAISGLLISLALSWLVLTYSTGNYITSTMAICTIGMIATIVLGFLNVVGWGLGLLESILIVIVVGFSVDYTVHLADSYMGSSSTNREGKVATALAHTGMSVLSGAISTILASIPMLATQISFFFKFGVFILLTIVLSLTFSLLFFASILAEFGPVGTTGSVAILYRGCVKRSQEEIEGQEAEQRLVDERVASERRLSEAESRVGSKTYDL